MRRTILAIAAALTVVPAAGAAGQVTVTRDAKGRAITLDLRAPGAAAGLYAGILRRAVHGDELSELTVTIVPERRIAALCGDDAAASCYESGGGRARIVVPAGERAVVAPLLLHEYGHHIDATRANGALPEPNGTPRWWAARRMGSRLRSGQVAFDYSRGWSHAVGEVFAEDYVQLNLPGHYGIPWLPRPSASVLAALRKDLGSAPGAPVGQPAPTPAPPAAPVVVQRSGVLRSGEGGSLPFTLLGPGRRVRVDAAVTARDSGATVEAVVTCDGSPVARAEGSDGAPIAIDIGDVGPGDCELTLTATGGAAAYDLELALSRTA
jgi:hypothetical protein